MATGWAAADEARFVAMLHRALDLGLNFLDSAPAYGNGRSEELLGEAIAGCRHNVIIATKFSHIDSEPQAVRRSLEGSLRRLRTDYIDVFQQHWPSAEIPLADTIGELERLKHEGKIRAIGVSNWTEPEWNELKDPSRIDSLQPAYNLLWRSVEKNVLPLCGRYGIAVLPYSPLCQGALAGRFRRLEDLPSDSRNSNRRFQPDSFPRVMEVLDAVILVASKYGKTPSQIALRWLLDQKSVTAVIVGASKPEQLEENLGAFNWQLEPADRQRLADVSWPLSAGLEPWDTLWGWHPKK
jgi:aryl-alcohol dehydrogenase-like predicted oxidoreductase